MQPVSRNEVNLVISDVNAKDLYYAEMRISFLTSARTLEMKYRRIEIFTPGTVLVMQAKWFNSNSDMRYVGSGISISHSPSYTAAKRFGFIMTMDLADTCYSSVTPTTTTT